MHLVHVLALLVWWHRMFLLGNSVDLFMHPFVCVYCTFVLDFWTIFDMDFSDCSPVRVCVSSHYLPLYHAKLFIFQSNGNNAKSDRLRRLSGDRLVTRWNTLILSCVCTSEEFYDTLSTCSSKIQTFVCSMRPTCLLLRKPQSWISTGTTLGPATA